MHQYTLKPDMEEAHRRWQAYWAGDLIGRPVVCVTAPVSGRNALPATTYYERVFGDLEQVTDRMIEAAECTFWDSPEECLKAHRQLKPNLTMYSTWASTPDQARDVLDQFARAS